MSDFFDSSVIIGMIFADCPEHAGCAKAWTSSSHKVVYSHGLLETFCQLTGGRLGEPLPPDMAAKSIALNVNSEGVQVLTLEAEEVLDFLGNARRHGVCGGAVYDYMHLCVARKAGADRIFTLNKRHFTAIAPDLTPKILHPEEL